ncbi:hypothetical protein [Roseivirga thermotolerans]|uniref:hypothetical protein n=1 Tax=Roseivirga thermotolerans TaxID=1758176 RepID=UPI00273EF8D6|nr:hypothetical protein [Roseivirga thermotolerans]
MKKITYRPLCQIDLLHSYYVNGIFRDAKVVPDQKAQVFMWNAGLLFKSTEKGFALYHNESFDVEYIKELTSFFGNFYLRFNLHSTAKDFIYITDTSLEQLSLYHFSNKNVSENDTGLLLPTLQADILMSGTLGFIDIHLDEFLVNNKLASKDYTIAFSARTTQWNYYLANTTEDHSQVYVIQDSEGNLFSGPEKLEISDGSVAYKYSSGSRYYPLREQPAHYCSLKKIGESQAESNDALTNNIVIEKLPVASPSSITSIENIDAGNQEIACSSIYVYL